MITICQAREFELMPSAHPEASHDALRTVAIKSAGELGEMTQWDAPEIDVRPCNMMLNARRSSRPGSV